MFLFKEGLPRWFSDKEPICQAGDVGSIPGSGRSPGVGNGNPLQDSCLENPMDGGTWLGYSPWGRKESGHNLATGQQQEFLYGSGN